MLTAPRDARHPTRPAEIAAQLREIAAWLRFRRGERFRVQAYERGAVTVAATPTLEQLAAEGRLETLPGIGRTLARQIEELLHTGRSRYLEELRGGLPIGLASLPEAAHLSPQKTLALHRALGVSSADELLAAARAGKVRGVRGFGERTEARILSSLSAPRAEPVDRLPVDRARATADRLVAHLRRAAHCRRVEVAGELRRAADTIGEIAIVLEAEAVAPVLAAFAAFPEVVGVPTREGDRACVPLRDGGVACVRVAGEAAYGTALLEETGPPAHVAEVRRRAGVLMRAAEERDVYAAAGVPFVVPEQRDRPDAFAEARHAGELLSPGQLRGVVHCHTGYSDGKNTVEEMALAAEALGFSYITITDHSVSAHYAGGLDLERLQRQWDEIDEVQARVRVRILRGTESDILRDGALDYPSAVLERLDVVIASIHTRHQLGPAEMTERVVRAIRQPIFKIWGHPLGRILLHREPYACDVERILDAVAGARAAIELNGDPRRLDLPAELVPGARARGIKFVVSSDAHSVRSLGYAREYGVPLARRGGLGAGDVLNTLPVDDFVAAVRPGAG